MTEQLQSGIIQLGNTSSENFLEILFAGDLCMRQVTQERVLTGKSAEILSGIRMHLCDKDLSIVNLENPLSNRGTPIYKSGPNISVDPRNIDMLKEASFDIVTLANNHTGDFGDEAVEDTIRILDENAVLHVGAGRNLMAAKEPLLIEKKGRKIALLNFAENETGIAGNEKAGAAPLDPIDNIYAIRKVAADNDIVLVLVHAGNEFNPLPRPNIVKLFHAFIDAGAAAIIGTHPHCPQGIEIYGGRPIIYSLGNFLFYGNNLSRNSPNSMWWRSHMVRICFSQNKAVKLEIIPYNFGPDASKIQCMDGTEREEYLNYLAYISSVIYEEEELKKYWNAWCDMRGMYYVTLMEELKEGIRMSIDKPQAVVYHAAHIFTTESHNDLMQNYLSRAVLLKSGQCKEYEEKIRMLQIGKYPKKEHI